LGGLKTVLIILRTYLTGFEHQKFCAYPYGRRIVSLIEKMEQYELEGGAGDK